jgi:hypothetical protein
MIVELRIRRAHMEYSGNGYEVWSENMKGREHRVDLHINEEQYHNGP